MAQQVLAERKIERRTAAKWWLLVILAVALAARLTFSGGLNGSDDLEYARYAEDILRGEFHLTGFSHANRWGMILPTVLAFRLFGVNEISLCLWPILASMGQVWVAYEIGKLLVGRRTGLIAASLLAIYPLDIYWSTQGLPEAPLAFLLGLSVLLFLRGSMAERNRGWYFFAAGVAFGLGFTVKETAVLLLLFYPGYALWRRQFMASIPFALAGWMAVLVPELIYYKIATGNLLFRFAGASATNAESMATGHFDMGYFQYFYSFFAGLLMNGLYYYVLLVAGIAAVRLRARSLKPVALWMLLLFLPMEFGIESINPITPIHKEVKTLTMLSIPIVIVIGWWISSLFERKRYAAAIMVLILLAETGLTAASLRTDLLRAEWDALRAAIPLVNSTQSIPVYTDNFTEASMEFLLGYRQDDRVHSFNKPHPRTGANTISMDFSKLDRAVAVINRRVTTGPYGKEFNIEYPSEINRPPSDWKRVAVYRSTPGPGLAAFLRVVRMAVDTGLLPDAFNTRASKALAKAVDTGQNQVEVYRIE